MSRTMTRARAGLLMAFYTLVLVLGVVVPFAASFHPRSGAHHHSVVHAKGSTRPSRAS